MTSDSNEMNDSQQCSGSSNAWAYIEENGPSTYAELPNRPRTWERKDGLRKFNITGGSKGRGAKGGGASNAIYYIEGEHSHQTVVEAWVDKNQKTIEISSDWALNQRCPERFREVLKNVLELDFKFQNPRGSGPSLGGECPMCGSEYSKSLPDHLPNCDAG